MTIPSIAVAFKLLPFTLVAQAAMLGKHKVKMDSVVISGSGTTATVTGALAITGTATATGLQINGVVDVTGTLTASTHPVMPRRWVQKQATSSWMSSGAYSNITGLTHSFTALANRVYGIHCDAEVQGTTSTSFPKVDVSVWDGATMLSSRGNAFVSAGVSNEQFVALSSSWIGTLTAGSHTIQCKYYVPSNLVSTLAGTVSLGSTDATGTSASFNEPYGVAISPDGAYALVADYQNHKIRKIVVSTAVVSTLAGTSSSGSNDATGTSASFWYPFGVAISPDGAYALVADYHRIRRIVLGTHLKITNSSTLRIVETVNGGTLQ